MTYPKFRFWTHVKNVSTASRPESHFLLGRHEEPKFCLELIHSDLCGPMNTKSLSGSSYFLLFSDDFSRVSLVYLLKFKLEMFKNFRKFKAMVEKQSGTSIKVLRTNKGGEFLSKEFNQFYE